MLGRPGTRILTVPSLISGDACSARTLNRVHEDGLDRALTVHLMRAPLPSHRVWHGKFGYREVATLSVLEVPYELTNLPRPFR